MTTQRFTTKIEKLGNKALIPLPFNPNEVWGSKARHQVTGTVNGVNIRGSLGAREAGYFLPLGPAWLRDSHLEPGALVEVVLSPEGPQAEALAQDIQAALSADPQAREFFEGLSTFYRKNYIRWVEGAKKPAVRAGRVAELVALLKAGKKQR